jgi:hypothetical protein
MPPIGLSIETSSFLVIHLHMHQSNGNAISLMLENNSRYPDSLSYIFKLNGGYILNAIS